MSNYPVVKKVQSFNIKSINNFLFLENPSRLRMTTNEKGAITCKSQSEISTNGVTFRLYSTIKITPCITDEDIECDTVEVEGWINSRAKIDDGKTCSQCIGNIVSLNIELNARLQIAEKIKSHLVF